MTWFQTDSHLKQYLHIIRDSPVYPVIYDSNDTVLSMPPIINGNKSRITLNTRNVFIECTGTDLTKTKVVLDTLVTMFSAHCAEKFVVEEAEVVQTDGSVVTYPPLKTRTEVIERAKVNGLVGVDLDARRIAELLTKMCLPSKALDSDRIEVVIPPTRQDILHPCDIYEDVAISYGYNNIEKILPKTSTVAKQLPLNKLTDQLRSEVAQSGFTETLTFSLCSRDDVAAKLRKNIEDIAAVHIANPKTLEFQVVRTTLLPGLLKTLASNKNLPLPLRLFEISDVVFQDPAKDVGASNRRFLCAVNYSKTSGFEVVHGLLDRIMVLLQIPRGNPDGYHLKSCQDETFFPGRCAEIVAYGKCVGKIGVLHPETLTKFDLALPCAALEMDLQYFL